MGIRPRRHRDRTHLQFASELGTMPLLIQRSATTTAGSDFARQTRHFFRGLELGHRPVRHPPVPEGRGCCGIRYFDSARPTATGSSLEQLRINVAAAREDPLDEAQRRTLEARKNRGAGSRLGDHE